MSKINICVKFVVYYADRIINRLIASYYYLKYFVYFTFFLGVLSLNGLALVLAFKLNDKLLKMLYYSVNLNGCILIKLIQWIYTYVDLMEIDTLNNVSYPHINLNKLGQIRDLFSRFFENCNIHPLAYTKTVFKADFDYDFDEIIELDPDFTVKSGSVAQVYKGRINLNDDGLSCYTKFGNIYDKYRGVNLAIKVVHPEIIYQMFFPIFFINAYKFLTSNIWFLRSYGVIFNFDSFFESLKLQISMTNEFNNISYFYERYCDNNYIIIPKPIMSSNNILIMEYVEAEDFNTLDESEIMKQKIVMLLNLFLKDTYMFSDKYHSDLHNANWKVRPYNNFYQLVIYDFGYIIDNNLHEFYKNFIRYIDLTDYDKIAYSLFMYIENRESIDINEFNIDFMNFINKYRHQNDGIILLYKFFNYYNYQLKNNIFELFISMILLKKNMELYIFPKIGEDSTTNVIKINIIYIHFLKNLGIFQNVQKYIQDSYLNDKTFIEKYKYNNEYFDRKPKNCDIESESIDI